MHRRINHFNNTGSTRRKVRRGIALIYVTMMMTVLMGFVSMGVDFGQVQAARLQAQAAADAAALYAADGVMGGTPTSVRARAVAAAADNKVNGTAVALDGNQDVEFGIWDSAGRTFTVMPSGSESGATAIRVTVRCTKARGTQIPLMFASILGVPSIDATRSAIATIGKVTSSAVPASGSPWLAGMPSSATVTNTNGNPTAANGTDNAPVQFATGGGTTIRFASAGGSTSWNPGAGAGTAGADGDATFIAAQAPANGINKTTAPLNAMMGIFLDNTQPDSTSMAAALDFSTAASRDFTSLSPQLKQVFFIGDGVDSTGKLQSFVAPTGATRLFIGTMDENGWWWDNTGSLQFTAVQGTDAMLVK